MENLKKQSTQIFESTNSKLEHYFSELKSKNSTDKKALSASHYIFLTKLLDSIKDIDALSAAVSKSMIDAGKNNDAERIKALNQLFDVCNIHRQNVEEYFNATQDFLKQDSANTIQALKQKTDELIRKTLMLRDLF